MNILLILRDWLGHSSMPHKGVSAVEFASKYANKLIELRGRVKKKSSKGLNF